VVTVSQAETRPGINFFSGEVIGKRLLHELVPKAVRIAALDDSALGGA
jgi:hypothetical protein